MAHVSGPNPPMATVKAEERGTEPAAVVGRRQAKCGCGNIAPSSPKLAFFEDRGEGSRAATLSCGLCGFYEVAHTVEGMARNVASNVKTVIERGDCPGPFTPHGPFEFDSYYCGCRGWD